MPVNTRTHQACVLASSIGRTLEFDALGAIAIMGGRMTFPWRTHLEMMRPYTLAFPGKSAHAHRIGARQAGWFSSSGHPIMKPRQQLIYRIPPKNQFRSMPTRELARFEHEIGQLAPPQ